MKNSLSKVQNKIISKYLVTEENNVQAKSTDVNILLNRVKLDKKREKIKKLIFSAIASTGVIVFGILVF
tara:strand:- start:99 stop:305 length:207 start_codon:yes stop_codon:yes gene_type:complete